MMKKTVATPLLISNIREGRQSPIVLSKYTDLEIQFAESNDIRFITHALALFNDKELLVDALIIKCVESKNHTLQSQLIDMLFDKNMDLLSILYQRLQILPPTIRDNPAFEKLLVEYKRTQN